MADFDPEEENGGGSSNDEIDDGGDYEVVEEAREVCLDCTDVQIVYPLREGVVGPELWGIQCERGALLGILVSQVAGNDLECNETVSGTLSPFKRWQQSTWQTIPTCLRAHVRRCKARHHDRPT